MGQSHQQTFSCTDELSFGVIIGIAHKPSESGARSAPDQIFDSLQSARLPESCTETRKSRGLRTGRRRGRRRLEVRYCDRSRRLRRNGTRLESLRTSIDDLRDHLRRDVDVFAAGKTRKEILSISSGRCARESVCRSCGTAGASDCQGRVCARGYRRYVIRPGCLPARAAVRAVLAQKVKSVYVLHPSGGLPRCRILRHTCRIRGVAPGAVNELIGSRGRRMWIIRCRFWRKGGVIGARFAAADLGEECRLLWRWVEECGNGSGCRRDGSGRRDGRRDVYGTARGGEACDFDIRQLSPWDDLPVSSEVPR